MYILFFEFNQIQEVTLQVVVSVVQWFDLHRETIFHELDFYVTSEYLIYE